MTAKIYLIVIGAILFIPIQIGMMMILPFPYGIAGGFGMGIIVLLIFIKKAIKEDSPSHSSIEVSDGMIIYCTKCGNKLDAKNDFCTKCGTELNDEK